MTDDISRGPGAPGPTPQEAARRGLARDLPRRFYTSVSVEGGPAGFGLRLDGRPVRTPAKAVLAVPASALAEALAEEWRAQGERIDPDTMPLTRLVNSALDGVRGREEEVRADLVGYAGSDLVCYRMSFPEGLAALQARHWDPVVAWAREALGVRLVLAEGVMPVGQPPEVAARLAAEVAGLDALRLAGLHSLTTLLGSVLLALAHWRGRLDLEAAWTAASLDEDWQVSQWGEDAEAAERRRRRRAEAEAASRLLALLAKG